MYLILCMFSIFLHSAFSVDLPADMIICKRSDPNISDCLKTAILKAEKIFMNGNEELGLQPLDPLYVPELILVQSKTNKNFQMSLSFKNLYIKGVSDGQFENFKGTATSDQLSIDTNFLYPHLDFNGDYELLGKLVLLPLKSKDKVHFELNNLRGKLKFDLEAMEKDGVKYLQVKRSTFSFFPPEKGSVKFRFNNLVKGNKELTERMNKVLDENAVGLHEVYKSSLDSYFSQRYGNVTSKFFSKVPMDQSLPA